MKTRSGRMNSSVTEESPRKTPNKKLNQSKEQKAENLVDSILKSVGKKTSTEKEAVEENIKPKQITGGLIKKKPVAVRGLPKSGRPWKEVKSR